tara:strand:- start:373 stop:684 length:312 start_codon:yes stop_codon:yes gene_type:complete
MDTMIRNKPLAAAQNARLQVQLDKLVRIDGRVLTWRAFVENASADDLDTMDGTIDYSRTHFNRLDSHAAQEKYMARLKAKTYYLVGGVIVAKIIYDHVKGGAA